MLTLQALYPLEWPKDWPRTDTWHRRSGTQFQCTPSTALADLRAALAALSVQYATVSSWLAVSRANGSLRLDAASVRLDDPGVVLSFVRQEREYVLARDAFVTPFANLRSIGLALKGLAAIERHGGSTIFDRAFGGFAALPPPQKPPQERTWREVLGMEEARGPAVVLLAGAEAVYRQMARKAHPDSGGSAEAMALLNRAIEAARSELSP